MPLSVSARRARCPILPGALAALANFFAGIGLSLLTPKAFFKAPGFLIAF